MIKLSDLANQLNIKEEELRKFIAQIGFPMPEKNKNISDKKAEKIRKVATAKTQKEAKTQREPSSTLKATEEKEEEEESLQGKKEQTLIELPSVISVKDFASILGLPVSDIITELIKNGVMANINEEIDFETAAIIADDLGFKNVKETKTKDLPEEEKIGFNLRSILEKEDKRKLKERPPVVTVMGHVDHGKTLLLDTIRKANVVASEAGGITQHLSAYQAEINLPPGGGKPKKDKKTLLETKKVTFLDTPGHEAFTAMRARGVHACDIVILVIDAAEGVKPQTEEVIDYIKGAKIPFIVALNKIDKPEAEPEKVKKQLADLGLVVEEWGGDVLCVPVSAKTGQGVDDLLEMVLLLAEMKEFKANPNRPALGTVIESRIDYGKGPCAMALIQNGILKQSDNIVIGKTVGKVRVMEDTIGKRIKQALPSTPVKIYGFSSVPQVGDILRTVKDEKEAKLIASTLHRQEHIKSITRLKGIEADKVQRVVSEGKAKELKLIIKADVKGSLEALASSLSGLSTPEVAVNIISEGVGDVSESDVMMARASSSLILGFNVGIHPVAQSKARSEHVEISTYNVIYKLIDDIKEALSSLLPPEIVHTKLGRIKVLKIFLTGKGKMIVGGKVTQGNVEKGAEIKVLRGDEEIGKGILANLQKEKKNVDQVLKGYECGVKFEGDCIISEGDILEVYRIEEKKRKL
jgi:translation initiation factor IF-2